MNTTVAHSLQTVIHSITFHSFSTLLLTPNATAAHQTQGFWYGQHSILFDSLDNAEELIEEPMFDLSQSGMMNKGDKIIFIAAELHLSRSVC